jgi:hypothetical protein
MTSSTRSASQIVRNIVYSPYGALIVLALFCHGLLLFTDYKIWDGWMLVNWEQDGRYDDMNRFFSEAGQPHYYYHRVVGMTSDPVWFYKLVSLFAYLGTGLLFYRVLTLSGLLRRQEAFIASAGMLTFPGMLTLGEGAMLPYTGGMFFFFVAAALAIAGEAQTGARHAALRAGAVAAFLLSFTYVALVVFYVTFYLLLMWVIGKKEKVVSWRQAAGMMARRMDYLMLPVAFWVFKSTYLKPYGYYAGYNQPQLDLYKMMAGYSSFVGQALIAPLSMVHLSWVLALVVAGVASAVSLGLGLRLKLEESLRRPMILACLGGFLLVMAALPYVAIGRTFSGSGYGTNYSLLVPLGGGLMLAALIGGIRVAFKRDARGVAANVALALVIAGFIGSWNRSYLHWQALGAKDRSVAYHLAQSELARACGIFAIQDEFRIRLTNDYPDIVRAVQAQDAMGSRRIFGYNSYPPEYLSPEVIQRKIIQTTVPYAFEDVDVHSRQAGVRVEPGPVAKALQHADAIAWEYLWLKHFAQDSAKQMDIYLYGLTDVQVRELLPLP